MGFLFSGIYAGYMTRNNAGAIVAIKIPWTKGCDFNSDTTDLTWEGDGKTKTITSITGFSATIEAEAFSPEILDVLFGLTALTTGLPVGVSKRHYYGSDVTDAGVGTGLVIYCTATDDTTGASTFVRIYAPRGTLQPPGPPTGLATKATAQMSMTFSADKTITDIAGLALPTVPTGGVRWIMDELSATTASY